MDLSSSDALSVHDCQVSSTAIRDELELIPLNLQSSSSSVPLDHNPFGGDSSHQIVLDRDRSFDQSQALLSLSLGNQGLYSSPYFIREDGSQIPFDSHGRNCSGQYMFESSDITNVGLNSRYLKPVQELLDETVSVWRTLKPSKLPLNNEISGDMPRMLTTNQDLNEKMSKLLNVLDELDGRYRQYRNQMEMLVSSFETLAGYGSTKPYTTLALQTISRQFRCVRDGINNQIRVIQKSLGEELEATTPSSSQGRLTRLSNLDLQFRLHKSVQQFGIMQQQQQQSWRPQRGLPENSVSILRAWLFEHFLNPYPKDSEKIMLARQAGLTRGQVANWFINARVRLWKPMVEEIYKEEFGEDAKASIIPEHEWKQQNHDNRKTTETSNGQNLVEEGNPLVANERGDPLYDDIGELGDLMVENRVSLALGLQFSERISSLPATERMPFDPDYIWEMNGR